MIGPLAKISLVLLTYILLIVLSVHKVEEGTVVAVKRLGRLQPSLY